MQKLSAIKSNNQSEGSRPVLSRSEFKKIKLMQWPLLLSALGLCGAAFVAVSVMDVTGIHSSPPWCGRWGAEFVSGTNANSLKVLATETGGPADRAGLKPGDAVDIGSSDPTLRFWEFYRAPNERVIDLTVYRASEKQPFPLRMVTGPRLSLWTFFPLDVGMLLLLLYACVIAWRKAHAPYDLMFATVLALIAVGILTDPARFWAPWSWVAPTLALISLTFPLSVPLWARLVGNFVQPVSTSYVVARRCCDLMALAAILIGIAQVAAVFRPGPILNPAFLVFGWLPSLGPIAGAILAASVCAIIAMASSSPIVRKQALLITVSPALLYWTTLASASVQRLSQSYLFTHIFLIASSLIYLILPILLICSLLTAGRDTTSRSYSSTRVLWPVPSVSLLFHIVKGFPKFILGTLTVVVFLWLGGIIWHNLFSHALYISDLAVPNDFADHGYSPSVEAGILRDDINAYILDARSHLRADELNLSAETPPIVVPQLNVPIDEFSDTAADLLRLPQRLTVTGDLSEPSDRQLRLQLRLRKLVVYDMPINVPRGKSKFILADSLFKSAPPALLASVQPYFVASHEYNEKAQNHLQNSEDDAERITHSGRPTDDPNVILSHLLLASIYMSLASAADDEISQIKEPNAQAAKSIAAVVKKRNVYESYLIQNLNDAEPFQAGAINHVWRGFWYLGEAQFLSNDQLSYDRLTDGRYIKLDNQVLATTDRRTGKCDENYGLPLTMSYSDAEYRRFAAPAQFGDRPVFSGLPTFDAIRHDECQALYEFNVALDLAPDDAKARDGLGLYYLWVGERDHNSGFLPESRREYHTVCPEFQTAASLEPAVGEHWLRLADLYRDEKVNLAQGDIHSMFDEAFHFDRDYFIRYLKEFKRLDQDYALHLARTRSILAESFSITNFHDLLTDRPGQLPAC